MIIQFSKGKIVTSPFELQVRFNDMPVMLSAMVDDIQCRAEAIMLIADAGAVRWTLKLDNIPQLIQVCDELGIQYQ